MTYEDHILDALGDPTRRALFKRLRGGARSVGDIAEGMDVSRSAVSQHLRVLKEAHLVSDRPEGTRRLYAVDGRGIEALRGWLDGFWSEALGRFKEAAEGEATREGEGSTRSRVGGPRGAGTPESSSRRSGHKAQGGRRCRRR